LRCPDAVDLVTRAPQLRAQAVPEPVSALNSDASRGGCSCVSRTKMIPIKKNRKPGDHSKRRALFPRLIPPTRGKIANNSHQSPERCGRPSREIRLQPLAQGTPNHFSDHPPRKRFSRVSGPPVVARIVRLGPVPSPTALGNSILYFLVHRQSSRDSAGQNAVTSGSGRPSPQ